MSKLSLLAGLSGWCYWKNHRKCDGSKERLICKCKCHEDETTAPISDRVGWEWRVRYHAERLCLERHQFGRRPFWACTMSLSAYTIKETE